MLIVSRKSLKWLPAVAAPALVAAGIIAIPLSAGAAVDLPDKSAEEVLLLISESSEDSFSGTVEKSAELGLPDIDAAAGMAQSMGGPSGSMSAEGSGEVVSSALELLSGTHEANVYVSGDKNVRVQVKDELAERIAVSNGTDAWYYDSESNVATHVAIPGDLESSLRDTLDSHADEMLTPPELADRLLTELEPTTTITVGTDARVAGRTVYELILTPKASGTLAESISLAVDSETGLPLQVTVEASGQDEPAFRVGFTSIDLADPAADLFTYTPGNGVTVEEQPFPSAPPASENTKHRDDTTGPTTIGTGWETIVTLPAGSAPDGFADNPMLDQLTTQVDGGRLLSTSLLNVFLTDDGRVFAGSVTVDKLQAAANAE
jgi:outer membrane lipoprotein-sorting protein